MTTKKKLSHYDDAGVARMVDVSAKSPTKRTARAHAFVKMQPSVIAQLPSNPKGNPLEIARVAGISAAKRTSDLIPLCHPLMLSHVDVEVTLEDDGRADCVQRCNHGRHRRGDGGAYRGVGRGAHGLRHDQGARQGHRDSGSVLAGKNRRQERRLPAPGGPGQTK